MRNVEWKYFNRFDSLTDEYMPAWGEGETKASQIVTAVSKLVYKCFNDGDVFDNTGHLTGWCNDLSSYANWLWRYCGVGNILDGVYECRSYEEYESLLADLADALMDEEVLKMANEKEKVGSIYDCEGPYKWVESNEDEDEDEWDDGWEDDVDESMYDPYMGCDSEEL